MNGVIVWADVETTGLSAEYDELLEIAILVTDYDLNILDDQGFHAIIKHDDADELWEHCDLIVQKMHDETGLWAKLADGIPSRLVDLDALKYVKQFVPEPKMTRLAGNSVRLDANFIEYNLPSLSAHLHYRLLDVSSIAFEAQIKGIPMFEKKRTHEAMSDIRESIAELKYLREALY